MIISNSSGSLASSAALHNSLQFLRSPSATIHSLRTFGFCGIWWLPSAETIISDETEYPHFLVLTLVLPRLTARRAAIIEPAMQALISKARALKPRPPSNAMVLSSMAGLSVSSGLSPKSQASECSSLVSKRTQQGSSCRLTSQTLLGEQKRMAGRERPRPPGLHDQNRKTIPADGCAVWVQLSVLRALIPKSASL